MTKLSNYKGKKPEKKEIELNESSEVQEKDNTPVAAASRQGRGPSKEALARRKRFLRKPRSGRRYVLHAESDDPNMRLFWVDNTPDRMGPLLDRGFEPVRGGVDAGSGNINTGENVGSLITKRVGQGKEFVLVQIPKEWYDADQADKQKEVAAKEAAIYGHIEAIQKSVGYGEGLKTSVKTSRGEEALSPYGQTGDE